MVMTDCLSAMQEGAMNCSRIALPLFIGWQTDRVLGGLVRHAGERSSFVLGFHHPDSLAIDEEQVICFAGVQRELAHGNPARCEQIEVPARLDDPAASFQLLVDILAGNLLWCSHPIPCREDYSITRRGKNLTNSAQIHGGGRLWSITARIACF